MTKKNMIACIVGVVLTTALSGSAVFAQVPPPDIFTPTVAKRQAAPEKPPVPLRVQVTLTRYEGDKKTSNLPFTLWVNANDSQSTSLNLGSQVAYPTTTLAGPTAVASFQYRNVGTTLTCSATTMDDGRIRLSLSISDSSMSPAKDPAAGPNFHSFQTQNYLLLRDGQLAQFVAATDKVTGEVTRVDVTVSVLK